MNTTTPTLHDSTPPSPSAEDLSVTHLVVCCQCSDGKLRAIAFDDQGKQAKQVHGYIRHICGGKLKLHKEPVALVQLDENGAAPAIRPNELQAESGHSWIPGFLIRFWKLVTGHSSLVTSP